MKLRVGNPIPVPASGRDSILLWPKSLCPPSPVVGWNETCGCHEQKIDPPLLDEGVALEWFQGHSLLFFERSILSPEPTIDASHFFSLA